LPKQVRPVDVSKVLYELHLLADRRDSAESAFKPVEISASGAIAPVLSAGAARSTDPDAFRRLETPLRDEGAEMRRFVVASLDSFAMRIVADLREETPKAASPAPVPQEPPRPSPAPWMWGAAAAAMLLPAAVFAWLWRDAAADRDSARKD